MRRLATLLLLLCGRGVSAQLRVRPLGELRLNGIAIAFGASEYTTVSTGGISFPYPDYLENIVRRVNLRFHPESKGSLHAEVFFSINRDGSVPSSSIRLVTRSRVYQFDAEAQAAVEAAASVRAFGPR